MCFNCYDFDDTKNSVLIWLYLCSVIAAIWRTATGVWFARSFACDWRNLSYFGRGFYCTWCQESWFRDCSVNQPHALYIEHRELLWSLHNTSTPWLLLRRKNEHDHHIRKISAVEPPLTATSLQRPPFLSQRTVHIFTLIPSLDNGHQSSQRQRSLKCIPTAKKTSRQRPVNQRLTNNV